MSYNVTFAPGASNVPIYTAPNGIVYIAGGKDANCTISVCPVELSVYGYRPSLTASGAMMALYGICIVIQMALGWRYKSWSYMAAMLLGCIDEILGYVGRIMYYDNPWGRTGFIMQIVLITIGPVFFSAAIYVMLSRIVDYISPKLSRFPPKLFYWFFIPLDILSLILQAAGGAISASSNGGNDYGVTIAMAGLGMQVGTLAIFTILTVDYLIRSRHIWTSSYIPKTFKNLLFFLLLATLLIMMRCCFRVYELNEGYSRTSKSLRDQPLFIGLESIAVVIAAYCLIAAHPGPVFNKGEKNMAEKIVPEKPLIGSTSQPATV